MSSITLPYPPSANRYAGLCVIPKGEVTRLGYVRLWNGGNRKLAHRVAWEAAHGPIPGDMEIDHLCHNRGCANLAHLEMVSHRVNSQRARNRKLTANAVSEIRATARLGKSGNIKALAAKFGVSSTSIRHVASGRFYA